MRCSFFVVWLSFSPYGKIRLGGEGSRPAFGDVSWYSMIFSAGIGIFWALIQGGIAVAVLLIGGEESFGNIQAAVIMLGMPFSLVLLVIMASLHKGLKKEKHSQ